MVILSFKYFYNNNSLANILPLAEVAGRFRITFDTEINSSINVNIYDGALIKFNQVSEVLYYYDSTNMEYNNINNQVTNFFSENNTR